MTARMGGSAGTAAANYRVDPAPHAMRPRPYEPGSPTRCADCGEIRGHGNHRGAS